MEAFLGQENLKVELQQRVVTLREADMIGGYHVGSALWCLHELMSVEHVERTYGLPADFLMLWNQIQGGMKGNLASDYMQLVIKNMPVGADLTHVWPEFGDWMFHNPKFGLCKLSEALVLVQIGNLFKKARHGLVDPQYWHEAAELITYQDNKDSGDIMGYKELQEYIRGLTTIRSVPALPEIMHQNALTTAVCAAEVHSLGCTRISDVVRNYTRTICWKLGGAQDWDKRHEEVSYILGGQLLSLLSQTTKRKQGNNDSKSKHEVGAPSAA